MGGRGDARASPEGKIGSGRIRRRLRWMPRSLRWRLAAWVALVVVASSGITFFAVYRGTGTQLRRQIDSEIAGDSVEFAHALYLEHARGPRRAICGTKSPHAYI